MGIWRSMYRCYHGWRRRLCHSTACPLLDLPEDLKQRIVDYLTVKEALRLLRTSHRVRCDLKLRMQHPFQILSETVWKSDAAGPPGIATIIPVFPYSGRKTHSITLYCQYWEVTKDTSKLYVVAHASDDDDFSFETGTIVCESDYAEDFWPNDLTLSFRPQPGKMYYLWYGRKDWNDDPDARHGHHELWVAYMFLYALVFDEYND